jgi:uncharacterized protein (DUF111 family)
MKFENRIERFHHQQEHVDRDMVLIQANYDDMNPEWYSHLMDRCFEAGANDVYFQPIIMKKGRPGTMINVFVHEKCREAIVEVLFLESTTLGVRWMSASCHRLGRRFFTVETEWGKVRIKVGYYRDQPVQVKPEYADCHSLSRITGLPLRRIAEEAARIAREVLKYHIGEDPSLEHMKKAEVDG